MKYLLRSFRSANIGFVMLILVFLFPLMKAGATTHDDEPISALTQGPNGSLWVLSGTSLRQIGGNFPTTLRLPDVDTEITPTALTTGADGVVYLSGPGMGVWAYDGGPNQWIPLTSGLPSLNVTAIAAHSTQPQMVYAFIPGDGIFRSRDRGQEWLQVDGGPLDSVVTIIHSNMPGSMESGWLFAGTERGVARSMDCFCFWSDAGNLRGSVSSVTFDPDHPKNVYALIDGQLQHSADGGESWSEQDAPFYLTAIAMLPDWGLVIGTDKSELYSQNAAGGWESLND